MKSIIKPGVAVIGLDGATFDVIDPLLEAGELPNLRKLIDRGIRGPLRSTIPPNSSVAWSSFITGKNPGKHGIYYFLRRKENSYERILVSSREIQGETLWGMLSRKGMRAGVMNVPMTYPPEEIDGFIICGLLSPSEESLFTHPPQLHTELISAIGDYTLDITESGLFQRADRFQIFKKFYRDLEIKEKAATYLLDTRELDFFMVVFTETDRLAHVSWRFRTPHYMEAHPDETAKFGELIPQCYRRLDRTLGKILNRLDDRTTVIVMSDHGSGPIEKTYRLNRWLESKGYLHQKPWLKYIPRSVKSANFPLLRRINWRKTRAYGSPLGGEDSIWINLKGREPEGVVEPGREYDEVRERLIRELREITDPDDGKPIIEEIYRREELYHGDRTEKAPDIVWATRNFSYQQSTDLDCDRILERPPSATPGMHRALGILIAAGDPIAPGKTPEGAMLQDLAPTILCLLKQPIPDDMDGRVLREILDPGFLRGAPPKVEKIVREDRIARKETEFTGQEEEDVKERLRGLGYIE